MEKFHIINMTDVIEFWVSHYETETPMECEEWFYDSSERKLILRMKEIGDEREFDTE